MQDLKHGTIVSFDLLMVRQEIEALKVERAKLRTRGKQIARELNCLRMKEYRLLRK